MGALPHRHTISRGAVGVKTAGLGAGLAGPETSRSSALPSFGVAADRPSRLSSPG